MKKIFWKSYKVSLYWQICFIYNEPGIVSSILLILFLSLIISLQGFSSPFYGWRSNSTSRNMFKVHTAYKLPSYNSTPVHHQCHGSFLSIKVGIQQPCTTQKGWGEAVKLWGICFWLRSLLSPYQKALRIFWPTDFFIFHSWCWQWSIVVREIWKDCIYGLVGILNRYTSAIQIHFQRQEI